MCTTESGPDGDVFSFAVVILLVLIRPELREPHMFANPVRLEREHVYEGG